MAKTESVAVQMKEILDEYSSEVKSVTEDSITETAKESVQKLKSSSPRGTGSYAKGWAVKKEGKMTQTVHNRTDYQLTHLLENGHIIRNKKGTYGRTQPIKHIEPVEEWAIEELQLKIERGLN